jgi:hypothetical protein
MEICLKVFAPRLLHFFLELNFQLDTKKKSKDGFSSNSPFQNYLKQQNKFLWGFQPPAGKQFKKKQFQN